MNLFYMSFSSGCIVLFTILLRDFFKEKLPVEMFCGLWWLAIFRALVPFSIVSDFSFYNLKVAFLIINKKFSKSIEFMNDNKTPIMSIAFVVIMILFSIVAILVARYFLNIHKNCSKIAENSKVLLKNEINSDIKQIFKKVSIKISPNLNTPVSYGLFKPVIILPEGFDLSNKKLIEYVFLHESIHIKYFHYLWKIISVIAVCIHWFNPFMWALYYFLEKDIEIFCDKKVIELLNESDRSDYAKTLIKMA